MFETFRSFFKEPCTLWFNQWGAKNWSHCCEDHDTGYEQFDLAYDRHAYRLMQDEALRECVNQELPGMGDLMFKGVRLFGWFFLQ